MLKRFLKVLFWAVTVNGLAISVSLASAAGCGCPDNPSDCGCAPRYQQDVVRAEVKNYDCSAPAPVSMQPAAPAYQAPVQQAPVAVRTRQAPEKVYQMNCIDEPRETRLAPLSNEEVARRGKVETVNEQYRFAGQPAPAKAQPEYAMSSRSARQQVFENEGEPCRDGSIFGGGPCKRKDKNGSIFGGGPCKNCTKNGSIFGGGPCKNCTKDGSIFPGGSCKNCKKPCQRRQCAPCRQLKQPCPQMVAAPKPECIKKYELQEVERSCSDFAPLSMEWVDFRIVRGDGQAYSRNLGKYRFRIFGCRRNTKNAILNEGRIVEKDMNFVEIFTDMVSDCYTIVNTQQCVDENTVLPEYVLTAEITDYFMNVCDEYNWDEARMENSRKGSSEMTVTWRLMDASKTNVLWKGESKGYAEIEDSEYNGEMILIQRAFADAADNLRYLPGFEDQLAVRVSPEEMQNQRKALMEMQRASGICQFKIVEDFGSVSTGYGAEEGWIEIKDTPAPIPTAEPIVAVRTPDVEMPIITPAPIVEMRNPAVVENSGFVEGGVATPAIVENSGFVEGSAVTPAVVLSNPVVVENSGFSEAALVSPAVVEDSGFTEMAVVSLEPVMTSPAVTEDSGFTETGMYAPAVKETSGVTEVTIASADVVVPAPTKTVEVAVPAPTPVAAGAIYEADKLCIVERADYENMGADTIGQTKNSVVAITNMKGKKGAGLLIAEQFVMTSADLVDRENNNYSVVTAGGKTVKAKAFRVNPRRNTALLVLSENAGYAPLALTLDLPPVGKGSYIAPAPAPKGDMAYLNNTGKVTSYRYTPDGTAEIVIETFEPKATIGTALIDDKGRVAGLAHRAQDPSTDLFLPFETAMRSLGVEICGKAFPEATPKPAEKAWRKPVAAYIDNSVAKAPEAMPAKARK